MHTSELVRTANQSYSAGPQDPRHFANKLFLTLIVKVLQDFERDQGAKAFVIEIESSHVHHPISHIAGIGPAFQAIPDRHLGRIDTDDLIHSVICQEMCTVTRTATGIKALRPLKLI